MNCDKASLSDYVHGFGAPENAVPIREHVSRCDSCRSDLDRLEQEKRALTKAVERFRKALPEKAPAESRAGRFWKLVPLAASFLLFGGVLWVILFPPPPSRSPAAPQAHELVEKLRSEKIEERDEATAKLKALGATAEEELKKAARDPSPEVAGRANHLLAILEVRRKLTPALLKALPGVDERLLAGGEPVWTEVFFEATAEGKDGKRRYPELSREDVEALWGPALAGARTDEEKIAVLGKVQSFKLHIAIPSLLKLLKNEQSGVGMAAAMALVSLGAKEAIPYFLKRLKDENATVRQSAVRTLGELGAKEAVPDLLKLLKDENDNVRWMAVWVLGELGAKEAIPDFLKLLKNGNAGNRQVAAGALAKLGAKEVIPDFLKLLKDEDAGVRQNVARALGSLGAKEVIPDLLKLLKDEDAGVRQIAADALVSLGAKEAIPNLLKLLKEENATVRQVTAGALGKLGTKEAIPDLLKLLKDEDAYVRQLAAETLVELGAKEAIPDLLKLLLKDENAYIRGIAAGALGKLGAKEAIPDLLKLLKDENAYIRGHAAGALGRLGAQETAPALRKLLTDPDPDTRLSAARALCRLGFSDGASIILEKGEGLFVLNALRSAEVWRRLKETPLGVPLLEGSEPAVLEGLARKAGLPLEMPKEPNSSALYLRISNPGGQKTLLDALEEIDAQGAYTFFLEADRIRWLWRFGRSAAPDLWREWWAQAQKEKK